MDHIMWLFNNIPTFHDNCHLLGYLLIYFGSYSKTCLKRPLKNKQNKDLNDKWLLNEGQKYCRMLPLGHSAILLTCIKR